MIKKILGNLYNMSIEQIEDVSVTLWDNIRKVLFSNTNNESNKEVTLINGGKDNE